MKRIFLIVFTATTFAQTPTIIWDQQKAETLRHYRALVQIDTSNPPGNETKAVDYLKQVLEAEGIATKTFASVAERSTAAMNEFNQVAEKYPHTRNGNMARYLAGVAAMDKGDNSATPAR